MFQRLRGWWESRRLERDRAFLLGQDQADPRVRTLLPLVEQRTERLRAERIRRMVRKP
jgi:hypothetical protein